MIVNIAYLGPEGTFTEEAALLYYGQRLEGGNPLANTNLIPFPSISTVAQAVATGIAIEGIVPIENSLEGSVTDTLDLLIHESKEAFVFPLLIRQEIVLPIEHCLLVKPGTQIQDIKTIFSHPQALAQCRHFLKQFLPQSTENAALSTAAAVKQMLLQPTSAAIGTRRAAFLYGAEILARSIQDHSPNATRFVILAHTDHTPTSNDKTSLCFSFSEDRPGLLYEVLKEFAEHSINLTKVESRPSRESLGRYIFLIDMKGHRQDPLISEVLSIVQSKTALFKILGSYPCFNLQPLVKGSRSKG